MRSVVSKDVEQLEFSKLADENINCFKYSGKLIVYTKAKYMPTLMKKQFHSEMNFSKNEVVYPSNGIYMTVDSSFILSISKLGTI